MQLFNDHKMQIAKLRCQLDEASASLDKLNGAIETVLWYQGHGAYLRALSKYIDESATPISRPPEIRRKDSNRIECVIWSLLSLMYGWYEDSPSHGVITEKDAAIAQINKWLGTGGEEEQ